MYSTLTLMLVCLRRENMRAVYVGGEIIISEKHKSPFLLRTSFACASASVAFFCATFCAAGATPPSADADAEAEVEALAADVRVGWFGVRGRQKFLRSQFPGAIAR